jgi:hypothetical protein
MNREQLRKCKRKNVEGDYYFHKWSEDNESVYALIENEKGFCYLIPYNEIQFIND